MTRIKLAYVHQYEDRHGVTRRYVRVPGRRGVKLPGMPGSAEFMDAYREAVNNPLPAIRSRHTDGTLGALVERFYRSAEFANVKASSQRLYRIALEGVAVNDGHRMVHDLPVEKARKIIEEIGETRPGMANLTRSVLQLVFGLAINLRWRTDNPFLRVPIYKMGTHHTWTDAEIAQFEERWPRGTRQRLAFDALLYTTQRIGDAVGLKRPKTKREVFKFAQEKTDIELVIGIHPELWRTIAATEARGVFLIGDAAGRPMTANALGKMMATAIEDARLPARCVAHGLRKAGLRRLAEHGATVHQLAAMSGHKSLKELQRYTDKVDQGRLAREAMAKLPSGKRVRAR